MYPKSNRVSTFAAACAALALTMASVTTARAQEPVGRFYGIVVNMSAEVPGTATTPINIVINRWSTAGEQDNVIGTVLEKGGNALVGVLQKMQPVGRVAPVGGVGFNIQYATRTRGQDGMERIVLLTDRPMSFVERWVGGRSIDYPFLLMELAIRPSGEGEGQIIVAARLSADKFNKELVVENLDIQPMQIRSLKREQ
jgi:hypothetical protein